MIKKYLTISLLAFNFFLVPAANVYAQDLSQDIAGKSGYSTSVTTNSLAQTVGKIIKVVLGLLGTIFLALTVYAGYLWLTSAGEEDKVGKAMEIIKTSIIGLIIIIAAYSITYFVVDNAFRITA